VGEVMGFIDGKGGDGSVLYGAKRRVCDDFQSFEVLCYYSF